MKSPAIVTLEAELVAQLEAICASGARELVASGQAWPAPRDFPSNPDGHKSFGLVMPFPRPRKKARRSKP